jgi:hypothetical protein
MSLFLGRLRLIFNAERRLKSSRSELFKSAAQVNFGLSRREYVPNLEGLSLPLQVGHLCFFKL